MLSETHPALSAPASVIYFVGWIEPRKGHRFAAFLRFTNDRPVYQEFGLDVPERRAEIARQLERHFRTADWRVLEAAVSMPGGLPASAPVSYSEVPVLLWPSAATAHVMQKPPGGYAA